MSADPLFLTGATGFLGNAVLQELLEAGYRVRCLVRRSVDLPDGAVPVPGHLHEEIALQNGMEGCQAVVHVAALVQDWLPRRRRAEFHHVNVDGLRRVIQCARQCQVPRFIYTSSFFALGPTEDLPEGVGDEQMPLRSGPFHHPYEESKVEGRRVFLEALQEGFPGVILYPTVIYGPGTLTEGNHIGRLIADFLKRRLPGVPGSGSQRWCFARVRDVAIGHRLALEQAESGSEYVLGGENETLAAFFQHLEQLSGIPAPRLRIPLLVLNAGARFQEGWAAITGRAPQLTSGSARIYGHHWSYHSQRAVRELGYAPGSLREGLKESIAWLRLRTA